MVSPDGFIITCAHVVLPEKEGDVDVKVSFFGVPGRYVTPHIIYVNKAMDIALVKVDVPVILPYLRLGSGESTQPGDPVTSMGHPAGYDWSVYSNKISAKRFVNTHLVGEDDEKVEVEQYEFQLQTPMLPGISGAPVVDEHGEVVCMVNLAFMPKHGAEIDFCIPVEEIKWVMETQGLR
jgi:S1-C subfamily serine protease